MMHRLLSTFVVLAWGLWFGAIVMVFVAVTSLFTTFADQTTVAGKAAAGIFRRFEVVQLGAAAVAVVGAVALRVRGRGTWAATGLVGLLSLATVGAIASTFVLTPRIDALRKQGVPSASADFKSLHRTSSAVYSSQAVLLLAAGVLLPGVIVRSRADAG